MLGSIPNTSLPSAATALPIRAKAATPETEHNGPQGAIQIKPDEFEPGRAAKPCPHEANMNPWIELTIGLFIVGGYAALILIALRLVNNPDEGLDRESRYSTKLKSRQ